MLRPVTSRRSITTVCSVWLRGLAVLAVTALMVNAPATAQQAPPGAAESSPPGVDPNALPAGESGTVPRQALPTVDPSEAVAEEATPQASGGRLPADYTPPAPTPEVMTLRKPSMTQEEITKEENDLRRLRAGGAVGIERILWGGDTSPPSKDAVARWARLNIAKMTAVDDWTKVDDITKEMMLLIRNAGMSQSNPNRMREFRKGLCESLTKECAAVLDNNFYVRMQAATILGQLNEIEEEPVGINRKPAVSYVPAMAPLLDVLEKGQPEAVKVVAAVGLARIADHAEVFDTNLRFRAADVLTKELANKNAHPWYQMRLAEALAAIELDVDRQRRPVVIESLLATIADEGRTCLGRTAAAKALGRTPIPAGQWNDQAVADAIAKLAHGISLSYNKAPDDIQWYECFANLYLMFKPAGKEDVARLPSTALLRKGTLAAPLDKTYQQILPIVQHVLKQRPAIDPDRIEHKPIPVELIQALVQVAPANAAQANGAQ